jgi:DNA ligase-associated metallophosphoesterase
MSSEAPTVAAHVEVRGDELVLFAERAAFWTRAATLLVADSHWGKAATFRAAGIPVPRGTTADGITRLDTMLDRTSARRVVFLGDFLHAREGRAPATLEAIRQWRASHGGVEMLVVRGNHDRRAGDPPPELGIPCVDGPVVESPFVFAHHPGISEHGYLLGGHLHPGVDLIGPGRQRERLSCFWLGASGGVLPAFGDFTGLWPITPVPGDRVFVIADGQVIERVAGSG